MKLPTALLHKSPPQQPYDRTERALRRGRRDHGAGQYMQCCIFRARLSVWPRFTTQFCPVYCCEIAFDKVLLFLSTPQKGETVQERSREFELSLPNLLNRKKLGMRAVGESGRTRGLCRHVERRVSNPFPRRTSARFPRVVPVIGAKVRGRDTR